MKKPSLDRDVTNPLAMAGNAVSGIASTLITAASSVPKVYLFVYAIVFLVVLLVVIGLIVAAIIYARPVGVGVCHSTDFEQYMDGEFFPDFLASLTLFARDAARYAGPTLRGDASKILPTATSRFSSAWKSFNEVSASSSTACAALLKYDDATLRKNLRTYFAHFRCFASRNELPYSMFCSSALANNPEFCDTGRGGRVLDITKVAAFERDFVAHVEAVRNASLAISKSADLYPDLTSAEWYRSDPARAFQWIMAAHKVRMYLNEYHPQINESAMSRITDKWAINTWILYYVPFVADIVRYRIPEIWRTVPGKYIKFNNTWKAAWGKLGNIIANIPCYMVFTGEQRAKYCKAKVFKN